MLDLHQFLQIDFTKAPRLRVVFLNPAAGVLAQPIFVTSPLKSSDFA